MRAELRAPVEELIERAKSAGALRADFEGTDLGVIHLMVGAATDFTEHLEAGTWRRYLQILLDGLRAGRHEPARLAQRALDDDELDAAMRTWPRGGRTGPRQG
jgi:hypothetical protein